MRSSHVPLNTLRFISVNAVVCGLEVASASGEAFLPPLLLKAGFSETVMSVLLGIGSLLALLCVPSIGRLSDNCHSQCGKRKPFIFGLGMVLIVALILVPLGHMILNHNAQFRIFGQYLIAIGSILLVFSSRAAFNPCESLVADMQTHCDSNNNAFKVYSATISFGACLGFLITSTKWSDRYSQEQICFGIVLVLFIICLTVSLLSAKEDINKELLLEEVENSDVSDEFISEEETYVIAVQCEDDTPVVDISHTDILCSEYTHKKQIQEGLCSAPKAITRTMVKLVLDPLQMVPTRNMPLVLRRLFWADLFTWSAILCHSTYYTDFVGRTVMGGLPTSGIGSESMNTYNTGVLLGSWGLFLQSVTSCLYATFIHERICVLFSERTAYVAALASFPVAMIGILLSKSNLTLNGFAVLSGIAFAEVTTAPNTLVTLYQSDSIYYANCHRSNGIATDIAVLDSAYFIAQILISCVGALMQFTGYPQVSMTVAAVMGVGAFAVGQRVVFSPQQIKR